MKDKKEVGKMIKALRQERNMSQDKLAELMGYTIDSKRSIIAKIESGRTNLKMSTIEKLSSALKVDPFIFIDFEPPQTDDTAMLQLYHDMSDEQKRRLLSYAKFIIEEKQ